ncbi:MAG TPA: serine hydrolase domain-containing protein, partial [Niabella sp.]|nr:serine hydrolase domain-containing protein [Niabella sp.]
MRAIYWLIILLFQPFLICGQKVDQEIENLMKQYRSIGLSAVVVKNNKIIYNKSFGFKNLEKQEPLAEKDVYRIASISKSFSATAILQLVSAKKISLNDDVSDLIGFAIRNPKFPEKPITLRMLLTHRSSLNDRQGYFNLDSINPNQSANWKNCYNDYPPDTRYQYCNFNYNIIGTIIERISGQRFDQYITHHILKPLGLYGGYCIDSLDSTRFTTLYEYDAASDSFVAAPEAYAPRREQIRNYKMGKSTPIFSPTGGMKMSATDLARYMMMHMNYGKGNGVRIIPKKYSKLMQQAISPPSGYGMAIMNLEN